MRTCRLHNQIYDDSSWPIIAVSIAKTTAVVPCAARLNLARLGALNGCFLVQNLVMQRWRDTVLGNLDVTLGSRYKLESLMLLRRQDAAT